MKNINIRQSPNDNKYYSNQNNTLQNINEISEINEYTFKKGAIPITIFLVKNRAFITIKSISYEIRLTPNDFSMITKQLFKSVDEVYLFIKNIFEKKMLLFKILRIVC